MQRRLAVVLMADIVDYSRTVEASTKTAIDQVRALRERWLEPVVAARNGSVEKRMGDGWLITFPSATDAVEAAREVQASLFGEPDITLRIALHLGEITEDQEEVFGTGINIAARLQTEAPPGGVMISSDCRRQLDPALAEDFADAGTLTLKNISEPVACYQWRPVQSERSSEDIPIIAVEPVSASSEDAAMCEAAADLREQLVGRLSRRTGVVVLALDEIVRPDIRYSYVLRGRVSRRRSSARAVLSLILRGTSQVVWSETYEGETEDPFELVDRVVGRAENALRIQINAFDGERLVGIPETSLNPSELRARAAHSFHLATVQSHADAERFLRRALVLDPDHPMSLSMLAYALSEPAAARYESVSPENAQWIGEAVNKAVRLAPRSDFVFVTRADMRNKIFGDLEGASSDVRRGLQINPTYAWGLDTEGRIRLAQGDYGSAMVSFGRAIACDERDPWLPRRHFMMALAQVLAGKPDEAAVSLKDALELRPDSRAFWLLRAEIACRTGDTEEEERALVQADRHPSVPDFHAMWLNLPDRDKALLDPLKPTPSSPSLAATL